MRFSRRCCLLAGCVPLPDADDCYRSEGSWQIDLKSDNLLEIKTRCAQPGVSFGGFFKGENVGELPTCTSDPTVWPGAQGKGTLMSCELQQLSVAGEGCYIAVRKPPRTRSWGQLIRVP